MSKINLPWLSRFDLILTKYELESRHCHHLSNTTTEKTLLKIGLLLLNYHISTTKLFGKQNTNY